MVTATRHLLRVAFAVGAAALCVGRSSGTMIDTKFVGTSPCGTEIRTALRIPSQAACDLIQWQLWIDEGRYRLRVIYGASVQGEPGPGNPVTIAREGTATSKGRLYVLEGGPSFRFIAPNVIHAIDSNSRLMRGNGGWSYTLYWANGAEPAAGLPLPSMSYPVAPLSTGPMVAGAFEGRSPCQRIARQLRIMVDRGCFKAKWRLTLYQNPQTHAPTTYKIEGSLFADGAREGSWQILTKPAVVYRLAAAGGQPALSLLEGDKDVLFLLGSDLRPMSGNADWSYTLNRRTEPEPN
jgi:hypothetical protein